MSFDTAQIARLILDSVLSTGSPEEPLRLVDIPVFQFYKRRRFKVRYPVIRIHLGVLAASEVFGDRAHDVRLALYNLVPESFVSPNFAQQYVLPNLRRLQEMVTKPGKDAFADLAVWSLGTELSHGRKHLKVENRLVANLKSIYDKLVAILQELERSTVFEERFTELMEIDRFSAVKDTAISVDWAELTTHFLKQYS